MRLKTPYLLFFAVFFSAIFTPVSASTYEVKPSYEGYVDFANDPAKATGFDVQGLCESILSRRATHNQMVAGCPVFVEQGAPGYFTCRGMVRNVNTGACGENVQLIGNDIVSFASPVKYAICPPDYNLVDKATEQTYYSNLVGNAVPATESYGLYFEGHSSEGTYCQRCEAPYEWSDTNGRCEMQCAANEEFNDELGQCVAKETEALECDEKDGQPVNARTGEKIQVETPDYVGSGEFPLIFQRTYKSFMSPFATKPQSPVAQGKNPTVYVQPLDYSTRRSRLGWNALPQIDIVNGQLSENTTGAGDKQWTHNYNRSIITNLDVGEAQVFIKREDNQLHRFDRINPTFWRAKTAHGGKLQKSTVATSNDYWHYYTGDGLLEVYADDGKLMEIRHPQGFKHTLAYTNDQLTSITDSRGRSLTLTYNPDGFLGLLYQPDGNYIEYVREAVTGSLLKVIFPDGDTDTTNNYYHEYTYGDARHPFALTKKQDSEGVTFAQWEYDTEGRATKSSQGLGTNTTYFDYQANKSVITRDTAYERTLNYTGSRLSTAVGNTCATDGTKGTKTFTYDAKGLKKVVHENGREDFFSRDSRGLVYDAYIGLTLPTTEPQRKQTIWHSLYAIPTRVTENGGTGEFLITDYTYNADLQLTRASTRGIGVNRTINYTYNANKRLSSIDGPRTDVTDTTTFTYHANGDLNTVTNALGHVTTYSTYNANGQPTSILDANGSTITLTYDARGRMLSQTQNGLTYQYTYSKSGLLTGTNDGLTSLTYEYDGANRLVKITDANGGYISYTYDNYDNITQEDITSSTQQLLYTLTRTFDAYDRVTEMVDANAFKTEVTFDDAGNPISSLDPLANTTQSQFDAFNRVTKVIDPLLGETSTAFNLRDQIKSITDANGNVTTYTVSSFNEVKTIVSPDTGTTQLTYDAASNMKTRKDARNITATMTYDALNRITGISYPDTTENVTFEYDGTTGHTNGIGRLTRVTGDGYEYQYSYDVFGNITKQTFTDAQSVSYVTEMTYTAGRLATLTYPSGTQLEFSYSLGQVSDVNFKVTAPDNTVTLTPLVSSLSYLPFGPMSSITYGNGKTLSQGFDSQYRLTDKTVNGIYDKAYTYNELQNISDITDAVDSTDNETYTYDALSRLTNAQGLYGDLTFTYDSIGNRLTKQLDSQAVDTYVYSTNQVTTANAIAMTYDAVGNMITRGTDSFTYNDANRLSQATLASGTYDYSYDYAGRRISKTTTSQGSTYLYSPDGMLLAELDASGQTVVEYYYVNGERVAFKQNNAVYYVHTSHLDYPLAVTDSAGSIVWQASTTPFGVVTVQTNTLGQSFTPRYPGQYHDDESSLYYNYFRDYDPELGRYIQSDPIGLAGGINTYAYVGGNPINFIDPDGRKRCSPQQARDLGLSQSNCWIGTDNIEGKCVTAECAANVLPNPKRTDKQACFAICVGMGQAEGKSLDEFLKAKADNYNAKACKDVNANIKRNKILEKSGAAGKLLGVATTGMCLKLCNDSFN